MSRESDQKAFDKMCKHLASMSERCIDKEKGYCVYLREDGSRCVVGALLSDEEIKKVGDEGVEEIQEFYVSLDHINTELLMDMQMIHDSYSNWSEKGFVKWEYVKRTAEQYGLEYNLK